jgi:hypothetical protein
MASEKLSTIREDHPSVAQPGDVLYGIRGAQEYGLLVAEVAAVGTNQQNTNTRLISGSVTWISGLTFEVSECVYLIEGDSYTSAPATITLDASDITHPRIDVLYVDTDSLAGEIAGTPAASPAKPEVDPLTQLELTFVTVEAGATTPTGISAMLLYGDNVGDPTEWDATASAGTIDVDNTDDPYAGTKAIQFWDAFAGQRAMLDAGSGNELTVGTLDFLELHVKAITWPGSTRLRVAFFNGPTRISTWVDIKDGNFGFDSSNTSDYQTVGIPNSAFAFTDTVADAVWIQMNGSPGGSFQAYVDHVRAQSGLTIINNFIGMTEEDLVNNVRTFHAQQAFGNDTLIDGATIPWNLDRQMIATVTLEGNRTLSSPTNIRAGGTYYLRVIQDGTGSRTLAYGAAFLWPGGIAPTLSTGAGAEDILTFVSFDGTNLYGVDVLDFS